VSSLACENELWFALALQHPSLDSLSAEELAGLASCLVVEHTKPDLFTLYGPSPRVLDACDALADVAKDLVDRQVSPQEGRKGGSFCVVVIIWRNVTDANSATLIPICILF